MHPIRLCALACLLRGLSAASGAAVDCYAIKVVDDATGRGVPLVELRTTNEISFWSDSAGVVAFNEPGLMDREVFFQIRSPGYTFPADGFGYHGTKLRPTSGGQATLRLRRQNLAERLYRITGGGIYRDSVLAGLPVPLRQPTLNGEVAGQDTVIATPYRGRIYWFWGDTNRFSYPLGNFGAAGATSEWPSRGGLDPGVGIDLTYFTDAKGFAKVMCPQPANGMRWIENLIVLSDESGADRLYAHMVNTRDLGYAHDRHLMRFNDEREIFEPIRTWDRHDVHQSSHPFRVRVGSVSYIYLFPDLRVPADPASLADLGRYEAYTCLTGDGGWRGSDSTVDRDSLGRVRWQWKRGADRLRRPHLDGLIQRQQLRADETWAHLRDFVTGRTLTRGLECVAWNEYRRRWIAFFADQPGEVWFAEADTPTGPWGYAQRVAEHGDQNFYNLAHHAFFDQDGGRLVYFEGTYTNAFAPGKSRTPRYDYNQMMYRLDLGTADLALPIAIYRTPRSHGGPGLATGYFWRSQPWARSAADVPVPAFFALPHDCRRPGTVPVYAAPEGSSGNFTLSLTPPGPGAAPLFVALPFGTTSSASTIDGEWKCVARGEGETGDGLRFVLNLSRIEHRLVATWDNGRPAGEGTERAGRLTLQLRVEDATFDCTATWDGNKLTGSWKKTGSDQHGSLSGERQDRTPPQWASPALVPLQAFRDEKSGDVAFAPADALPTGTRAVGPPLVRVWRRPNQVSAADWDAEPVPTPTGLPPASKREPGNGG